VKLIPLYRLSLSRSGGRLSLCVCLLLRFNHDALHVRLHAFDVGCFVRDFALKLGFKRGEARDLLVDELKALFDVADALADILFGEHRAHQLVHVRLVSQHLQLLQHLVVLVFLL